MVNSYGIRFLLFIYIVIGFIFVSTPSRADENDDASAVDERPRLTDEEVDALLQRVDSFFINQDMADISVDLDLYRDPSNRLDDRSIRSDNPSHIAGLSTIVSHYLYTWPEYFQLTIMGEVLAGSEVPAERTFYSQLLPMPGAPIYTNDIKERFYIRFDSYGDVDGTPTYRIRFSALEKDTEFFDYIVYFIDIEREVILRVESAFDNYWYVGTGQGNFYYDDYLGKYVPIYGHGTVIFNNPTRRYNIWGRWYKWNWKTRAEYEATLTEPVGETSAPSESEAGEISGVEVNPDDNGNIGETDSGEAG